MEYIVKMFDFMKEYGINNMTMWKTEIEKHVDFNTWEDLRKQGFYVHARNGMVFSVEDPYSSKWIEFIE